VTFDQNSTIAQFLDGAAAKQPAPGGGSVTALAGALAAAMGEMVLNYSVGKRGLEAHQAELRAALAELHRARRVMIELMAEDQSAYQALSTARKLPNDSADWRGQFPAALLASIRTPEAIAATALAVLELCDRVCDFVNAYLLSDLAVCAELAMCTVRCGIYNVRVNLADVTDPSDRRQIESTIDHLHARALPIIQRLVPRVWQRIERGA
jgi:formiminotetrahydrofolate cyclodeaminase